MSIFHNFGTEPPFRANLFFGYVPTGPERNSFTASTVLELEGATRAVAHTFTSSFPQLYCCCLLGRISNNYGRRQVEGSAKRKSSNELPFNIWNKQKSSQNVAERAPNAGKMEANE